MCVCVCVCVCGVVWCGVVWCGVVWYGVVWCGVVWCGVAWRGVVWCGVVWVVFTNTIVIRLKNYQLQKVSHLNSFGLVTFHLAHLSLCMFYGMELPLPFLSPLLRHSLLFFFIL